MRILILGPHPEDHGGVSSFVRLLLRNLRMHDVCVKYFTVGKRKLLMYRYLLPVYFIYGVIRFIFTVLTFCPDAVHINPSLRYKAIVRDSVYLVLAKVFGCRALFFIHGWSFNISRHFTGGNVLTRTFLVAIFSIADRIIVLANRFKEQLVSLGIDASKIDVFPIMVEYRTYLEPRRFFTNSRANMLFLATITRDKGIYEAIGAVTLLLNSKRGRSTKLIVAGDGVEVDNITGLIEQLELKNNVILTGYVSGEKKIALFSNADLFVFPSHGEGFPTVIAEAMAAGLPIIATPVGAIREIIEHGVNGILISKPDAQEFADAILYLLKRPRLMRKMGKLNREKAKDYDVSVVCNRLMTIYNEVASSRS